MKRKYFTPSAEGVKIQALSYLAASGETKSIQMKTYTPAEDDDDQSWFNPNDAD